MAIAQWADPDNQFYGKYIGSAFSTTGNNPTLMRNPTAANRERDLQSFRRWLWSRGQRLYKVEAPPIFDTLTECGQNNPHVNSRGEVVYPNRYHKWLQCFIWWWMVNGTDEPEVESNASSGVDWYADNILVEVRPFGDPPQTNMRISITGVLTGITNSNIVAFMYMSRPVGGGVTRYTGNWVNLTGFFCESGFQQQNILGNWWAIPYQAGDRVFVRFDCIDFYRAFVWSVQLEPIILQAHP